MSERKKVELFSFEGTHRKLGRTQGEKLRELIARSKDTLKESVEFELLKPEWMPADIFIKMGEILSMVKYAPHMRNNYPEQYRRLLGIARGARVPAGFVMLLSSFEIELNKVDFQLGGCSGAGISGARSASGEPVIIKNFDYPEHFIDFHVTRLDAPKGRAKVLNVSSAPLAGSHEGVNEFGLSIAYNYGYGQDSSPHKVAITTVVQEALETCKYTGEAVDLIANSKRCGGAILMICDAGADLRVLELSNANSAVRFPEDGLLLMTNHYLDEKMAAIDVPPDAYYTQKTVPLLRGCRCRESSESRYARLEELLGGKDTISERDLVAAFSDHGPGGNPSDNTVCRHSDYFTTTCSVMIYPARCAMKVMYGNPCSLEYDEFSI